MSNFRATKSQLIELIINAGVAGGNNPIYFQNQPQLQTISGDRKVYIQGITAYSSLHLSGSPLTTGNAVATPADIINATLTLNVFGTLEFQNIPLVDLVRSFVDNNTTGVNNVHQVDLFRFRELYKVDWTKSYIQLIGPPSATPLSYLFNVYYRWDTDNVD